MKLIFQLIVLLYLLGLSSCFYSGKKSPVSSGIKIEKTNQVLSEADLEKMSKDEIVNFLKKKSSSDSTAVNSIVDMSKSLSFRVKNASGKSLFVTCLYWMKNNPLALWRWDKSKVYKIDKGKTKLVVLDEIPDSRDRAWTFGYLAVFDSLAEANKSTMELVNEKHLIDIDLLAKLKDKVVTIFVKKYGISGDLVRYTTASQKAKEASGLKKFDILVSNQTGKDVFVNCFVYEQPEYTYELDPWLYSKTKVKKLHNGQEIYLDLPVVLDPYKWSYMRGVLGVFDGEDSVAAENATFETAKPLNKIELGLLTNLVGKKIVLSVEHYGVLGDFIDYVVKPAAFGANTVVRKK